MEAAILKSPGGDSRRSQKKVSNSQSQSQFTKKTEMLQEENPYPLLLPEQAAAKSCGLTISGLYQQLGPELVQEMSLKIEGRRYFIAESLRQWLFEYRCYCRDRIQVLV